MRPGGKQPPAQPVSDGPAEIHQRRRQTRGLLVIGLAILTASVLHAGIHRVFTIGWWRLW